MTDESGHSSVGLWLWQLALSDGQRIKGAFPQHLAGHVAIFGPLITNSCHRLLGSAGGIWNQSFLSWSMVLRQHMQDARRPQILPKCLPTLCAFFSNAMTSPGLLVLVQQAHRQ